MFTQLYQDDLSNIIHQNVDKLNKIGLTFVAEWRLVLL